MWPHPLRLGSSHTGFRLLYHYCDAAGAQRLLKAGYVDGILAELATWYSTSTMVRQQAC